MSKKKSYFVFDRSDIAKFIPKGTNRVLDVGCASGVLGKELKRLGMEVVGIELDPDALKEAEKNLDRAFLGNVENFSPPFPEGYFDCIIFADILEHLHNPQETLRRYRVYLNDEGVVISSIPNVRYYKVIAGLLRGVWDYVDLGTLDKSHLRFFALINIKEMFQEASFRIEFIQRNVVAARALKICNFFMFDKLREFLTYQYYIIAKKNLSGVSFHRKRKLNRF